MSWQHCCFSPSAGAAAGKEYKSSPNDSNRQRDPKSWGKLHCLAVTDQKTFVHNGHRAHRCCCGGGAWELRSPGIMFQDILLTFHIAGTAISYGITNCTYVVLHWVKNWCKNRESSRTGNLPKSKNRIILWSDKAELKFYSTWVWQWKEPTT